MLSDEQKELITAAVDGELSTVEIGTFRQLVDSLPDARALFAQLKADSQRVQSFPQVTPPADLHAKIMASIVALVPNPAPKSGKSAESKKSGPRQFAEPTRATPTLRSLRSFVPVAVAASILLCITAGSFVFFINKDESHQANSHPTWSNNLPAAKGQPSTIPSPNATVPREQRHNDPESIARTEVSPVPPPRVVLPRIPTIAPEPRPVQRDLLTSPILPKLPPFDLIQVRLPFLRTIGELTREDTRQELTDELAHDPPFRIDLFVRDPARGVEVFQRAAKLSGVTLFEDAATLEKLKKRHVQAAAIYIECLTPAELTELFAKVSAADMKFTPRVCDSIHVMPIIRADEIELKLILGIDPGLYKRPNGVGNNGTGQGVGSLRDKNGSPQSVSAGTIDSVTKSLTTPPTTSDHKSAVLLTWQTTYPGILRTPPAQSKELKQFLAKRGERKPNAVPAIIVIRTMK